MSKAGDYRQTLRMLKDWDTFLLQESGLPGPRGNLELAQAVAEEGDEALFKRYLLFDAEQAPVNSPYEFLAFCGVVGLGKLLAQGKLPTQGKRNILKTLRRCASDPRWRTREAVAMALQRWGEVNMDGLLQEMARWSQGSRLEQRAAAAALCEPKLLHEKAHAERVLHILDAITGSLQHGGDQRSDDFKTLRQALGYCWSVAVAALPEMGRPMMEQWFDCDDRDVRWVIKENLKKKRLARLDAQWIAASQQRLERKPTRKST